MPLYEYACEEDGSTLTLLRSMAQADDPVEDPEGRNRNYTRVHSTFQTAQPTSTDSMPSFQPGAGCGCGHGGCGH